MEGDWEVFQSELDEQVVAEEWNDQKQTEERNTSEKSFWCILRANTIATRYLGMHLRSDGDVVCVAEEDKTQKIKNIEREKQRAKHLD